MVEYSSHGLPLESYRLTRADHRGQADLERKMEWIRIQLENAPPVSAEGLRELMKILGPPTPDHELMRWRVRLFCGRIVEISRHARNEDPFGSRREHKECSDCDDRDQLIVAYESIGLLASPPVPHYMAGIDGALRFHVMRLIDGPTLADRVRLGPVSRAEVGRMAVALGGTLAHIHT
jgi:hypothetical protein